jgi:hypothetical protein
MKVQHHALGRLLMGITIMVVMLVASRPSEAVPVALGTWWEFSWTGIAGATGCQPADPAGQSCTPSSGGNTSFVGAPPWTFASALPTILTVTDAFQAIDRFFVLDNAIALGPTSVPSNNGGDICGSDPVPCLADPRFSHGTFDLAAGAHSLTMIQILNDGSGAGYFRLDPVPEPGTLLLFGTALTGLGGLVARRRAKRR